MKIKTKVMDYDRVLALPRPGHLPPLRPGFLFRLLIRAASVPELRATRFSWEEYRMEEVKDQPCLILMNHSCFLDLSIVSRIFFPRPYCIVCTSDGFVGKRWLMRHVGCIPEVCDGFAVGSGYDLRPEGAGLLRPHVPGGQLFL